MAIAGIGFRRGLFVTPLGFIGRGYLSAEYNLAKMVGPASGASSFDRVVHGGAIGLDFDTMMGPIRLALGIGNAGKPRLYLSVGPSF